MPRKIGSKNIKYQPKFNQQTDQFQNVRIVEKFSFQFFILLYFSSVVVMQGNRKAFFWMQKNNKTLAKKVQLTLSL